MYGLLLPHMERTQTIRLIMLPGSVYAILPWFLRPSSNNMTRNTHANWSGWKKTVELRTSAGNGLPTPQNLVLLLPCSPCQEQGEFSPIKSRLARSILRTSSLNRQRPGNRFTRLSTRTIVPRGRGRGEVGWNSLFWQQQRGGRQR